MNNLLRFICFFVLSSFGYTETSAQHAARFFNLNNDAKPENSVRFIEGIEITGGPDASGHAALRSVMSQNNQPVGNENPVPAATGIEGFQSCQFKYALMMNREVEACANVKLFRFIDTWWGTRYRYGGTTHKGIDCSAFSAQLFCDVYSSSLPRTARDQFKICTKVSAADMKEGDLLFFNTRGGISHVGVYLGDQYFVHASTSNGVVISSLDEDYYRARFLGAGRLATNSNDDIPTEDFVADCAY